MGRHSGRAPLWRESRNPVNTGLLIRVIPPPGRLAWAASRLDFVQKGPAAITGFRLSLARARSAGMTTPGELYKASKRGSYCDVCPWDTSNNKCYVPAGAVV